MSKAEDNLREHQGQMDEDGIMVSVSREALNQVLDGLNTVRAETWREARDLAAAEDNAFYTPVELAIEFDKRAKALEAGD